LPHWCWPWSCWCSNLPEKPMKYFLIAGEASGDLHASNLMRELFKHDPAAEFRFMGGDLMEGVAPGLVMHYRETSYMMLDVLLHLGKILRNMRKIKSEIRKWRPDAVIPVDYPGFNMRMAKYATSLGLPVHYFISPKVWAWKQRRIKQLKQYTNRLFVILPFEVEYFLRFGMEVEYFGNPLVDGVKHFTDHFEGKDAWKAYAGLDQRPVVALLAGSRVREIEATLPVMLRVAAGNPDYQFVVAGAPSIDPGFYSTYLQGLDVKIVHGETYALLSVAHAGMITSGTATLEAALFHVPQVVVYRTGPMAYALAKRIIKINFISLVNLILGRGLVREIIQDDLYERSEAELSRILEDRDYRQGILDGYREMEGLLGETGVSGRIAARMVELLKE
jgi:lipid-A-disaccharide synthase